MLKICIIIGVSMLVIGIGCNVTAIILEKKYKNKMQSITKN